MTDTTKLADEIHAFLADAPKGKPHEGYRYGELLAQALAALRAPDAEKARTLEQLVEARGKWLEARNGGFDDPAPYIIAAESIMDTAIKLCNAAVNGSAAPVADNLTPSAKPKPGTVSATPNATPGAGSGATPCSICDQNKRNAANGVYGWQACPTHNKLASSAATLPDGLADAMEWAETSLALDEVDELTGTEDYAHLQTLVTAARAAQGMAEELARTQLERDTQRDITDSLADELARVRGALKGGRQKLATYQSVYPDDKELRRLLTEWDAALSKEQT